MKLFITKTAHGLTPADKQAEEEISKWKVGTSYLMKVDKARCPAFHRLVFAVAQMTCDNAPEGSMWSGKEALSLIKAVELACGMVETLVSLDGEVHMIPLSIAFQNMVEDEFSILYKRLIKESARILDISEQDVLDNLGAQ
jgi:hypothetical protein